LSKERQSDRSTELSTEPNEQQTVDVEAAVEVQLDVRFQRRNMVIYVLRWCVVYFASPVLYVGFVQVGLCKRLGASDFVANLPSSAYLLLAVFPIIMAWAVPQARCLKLVMTIGYLVTGVMGAITAAVLWLPFSNSLRIAVIIIHGAIVACSSGTAWAFEWELIGRSISESRRGAMFAIAFSVGPVFAVIGALTAQLVITNEVLGWTPLWWSELSHPVNYTILYAATLPLMFLAAILVSGYVVPLPAVEVQRKSFVQGTFGGFGRFVNNRLIVIACLAYLLIYSGTMIQNNMMLYTREAVGLAEDTFVGYQLAIRFGCKIFAGLLLGLLLKFTNPRMNLYVTALLVICGVAWILVAPLFGVGLIFLIAFGFNGAGELMGNYYPYYVLCLSPKSQMRRNMAFLMLLTAPVGFAPALYGAISDTWSLTASFWVAMVVMALGLILVAALLPARPRPQVMDLEPTDQMTP